MLITLKRLVGEDDMGAKIDLKDNELEAARTYKEDISSTGFSTAAMALTSLACSGIRSPMGPE